MNMILWFFLLVISLPKSLACFSSNEEFLQLVDDLYGFTTTPPPTLPPTTPKPTTTTTEKLPIVQELLGPDVERESWDKGRYIAEGGGPVVQEGILDCDFGSECCWTNAEPPEDQLQWAVGKGTPVAANMKDYFGADTSPDGKFLLVASGGAEDPFAEARFISCSITCTDEEVVVTFNHWTTDDVELQVCTKDTFSTEETPLLNCIPVTHKASGGPSEFILPPGEVFDVVIVAKNFLYQTGGAAIIDNVKVDYKLCVDTTLEPTTLGPPKDCADVECDFETGYKCNYQDALSEKTGTPATSSFQVKNGRFKNQVTGIRYSEQGNFFLATYLKAVGQSAVLEANVDLEENRVIRFLYYEATDGIQMSGCCNSLATCPFQSVKAIEVVDRAWATASFQCPKGTKKILFLCYKSPGEIHEGACGLDDFRLFVPDGQPANAKEKVCD